MVTRKMKVNIATGLEARPVALLVQKANQYESTIYIESGVNKVNAKSIMGMMTLGLAAGESIVVEADGKDEEAALNDIENFLNGNK